jgi:hypothetical protein
MMVAGLAFAVLHHVDARRKSTCSYQLEALRSEICRAARLEIMVSQIDPGNRPVGDTLFFVVDEETDLRTLSHKSLWPTTSEFFVYDPDDGPIGWKPLRSMSIQVVPHTGATQYFTLQDCTATLRGGMVQAPLEGLEIALLDVLHDLREDGCVTRVRDGEHAIQLFTGLAERRRALAE